MISFEDLTLENWPEFRDAVLNSELAFQGHLRWSEEGFLETLKMEGPISKIAKLDSSYVGNMLGCDVVNAYIKSLRIPELTKKGIYVYNIVIDPPYQSQGHGGSLLEEFIAESQRQGYKLLVGHFRPNNSLSLIKKRGAKELSTHEDWAKTGETYSYCELKI